MKLYEIYSWGSNFALIEAEKAPRHSFFHVATRIASFEAETWEEASSLYFEVINPPLAIRAVLRR